MDALKEFVDRGGRDDLSILKDDGIKVSVGGHPVCVRAFTLANHRRYILFLGTILQQFNNVFDAVKWPENPKELEQARQRLMGLISIPKLYRAVMRMFKLTLLREPGNRYWRWHIRKFEKTVTIQEFIDLFFYVYLWNMEAVKKNVSFLLERMGFIKQKATLLSGWGKNLAGVTNTLLKPRHAAPSWFADAAQSSSTPNPVEKKRPGLPVIER